MEVMFAIAKVLNAPVQDLLTNADVYIQKITY